ncbi:MULTISPECIES: plasmid mobilization protein [Bacilli]|jgi:phage terminase large subunit-like protein|uniref:Mobilization protein n=5 Tax=Bacilli TaxID=91061 RepID=Q848T2_ENTFC|nr:MULTISPECIES: plasmid mobilization relaxosome protein MobC [Bacilli]MDN6281010.1 MobC family plasmid mobilization relaxosome protein [Psychroflexus sp.]HAQ1361983.1 MobC family plasmid mobilization relaxosome protein [Enterococcus faecium Ef_aus0098]HAQ1364961.1 MobC family plasmid mobilization relaxosome protein [Enterococcus faecium Ef_aus0094]HAQ1370781.1 MobC family plasmid mobilization relaxosome protein [Enterococcus faecium Ef_aus0100]AAO52852.1 putative mobilization protein [Enteroc
MSEHDNNLASDLSVGGNRKPNRKEPKQISFRVNEGEYEKLRSSAETLNMSVPTFVKKKAQGSRLVAPKLDKETRQSIVKDLGSMGANVNQIAKWFNQHKEQAVNLPEQKYDDLIKQFDDFKKELHEIWQQLK